MKWIRWPRKGLLESLSECCYPYILAKKLIKRYLDLEHQASWNACNGCCQSKTLIRYPLPSTADELLAMSILRLRVAVAL
jgi:hypothetical protein